MLDSLNISMTNNLKIVCLSVWVRDKSLKKLVPNMALGSRAYALRQRMLNFVQNFEYYFMLEVIEPYWQLFELNMSKVGRYHLPLAI